MDMNRHRFGLDTSAALFSSLFFVLLLASPGTSFCASQESSRLSLAQHDPHALVQQMVGFELKGENDNSTHWRFRKVDIKPGISKTWDIIETNHGEVQRLLEINGHPLNSQQEQAERQRIQKFLSSATEQQQKNQAASGDSNKEQRLMRMLPNALLYTYVGHDGNLVTLRFRPNPQFNPSTREAQVFHHMVGKLVIDISNMRIAQFSGRIATPVEFGWGLLGHLNKGGTFDVKQGFVADEHWDLTLLDTEITGKVLFFKGISVREKIIESDYQRVPNDLTLQQAANMLKTPADHSASEAKDVSHGRSAVAGLRRN